MKVGNNLWEAGGPGGIVTMTEGTVSTSPWGPGSKLVGGLRMLRCRAMAGLTRHSPVIRFCLEFINIIVAVNTSLITGIANLLRDNLLDDISAVVPILSE